MATHFFWKTAWHLCGGWDVLGAALLISLMVGTFMSAMVAECLDTMRRLPRTEWGVPLFMCGVFWPVTLPIAVDVLPFYGLYRLFRHLVKSRGKRRVDLLYEANLKIEELERKLGESKRKFSELQDEYANLRNENTKLKSQFAEKTNGEEVGNDGYVKNPVYFYRYYFWEQDRAKAANQILSAIQGSNLDVKYVVDYSNTTNEAYAKVWFNPLKHKRCEIQKFLAEHI